MPPSQLAIATSSITRLLKDEDSYRTELASQQKRLERLEAGGGDREDAGNVEFQLRQEVSICVFPIIHGMKRGLIVNFDDAF